MQKYELEIFLDDYKNPPKSIIIGVESVKEAKEVKSNYENLSSYQFSTLHKIVREWVDF